MSLFRRILPQCFAFDLLSPSARVFLSICHPLVAVYSFPFIVFLRGSLPSNFASHLSFLDPVFFQCIYFHTVFLPVLSPWQWIHSDVCVSCRNVSDFSLFYAFPPLYHTPKVFLFKLYPSDYIFFFRFITFFCSFLRVCSTLSVYFLIFILKIKFPSGLHVHTRESDSYKFSAFLTQPNWTYLS